MRPSLIIVLLLLVTSMPARAVSESKSAPGSAPAASAPFASEADAVATLKGYLERMKITFESTTTNGYPMLSFTEKRENATHRMRVIIDGKRGLVYIFLNRYLSLPDDSPNRNAVLRELMKKNWDLNIGKFEWDPSDGEVRFSYCFTTENGIGYEAFEAIVGTLFETGDKYWPELRKMAAGEKPSGGK